MPLKYSQDGYDQREVAQLVRWAERTRIVLDAIVWVPETSEEVQKLIQEAKELGL